MTYQKYVQSEDDFLVANYKKLGQTECGEILGRSKKSVSARASMLGLTGCGRYIRKPSLDDRPDKKKPVYKIRKCLQCQQPFPADHRTRFMCALHTISAEGGRHFP